MKTSLNIFANILLLYHSVEKGREITAPLHKYASLGIPSVSHAENNSYMLMELEI